MAVYQQSTLPFSSARSYVAAAGGSEGDSTTEILAGRAISAALERYYNFWRWEHYFTVASAYNGVAGTVIAATGASISFGSIGDTVLTVDGALGTGAYSGVQANPPNAPGGFGFVVDIGGTMRDMTFVSMADNTMTLTMTTGIPYDIIGTQPIIFKQQGVKLPSDVRDIYDVRLLRSGRVLEQLDQRAYDLARYQNQPGTTTHYGLFAQRNNVSGALNLFPPPIENDQIMIRYYRRPAMPVSAATVLDIPQDAEHTVLSLSKSYFLADRGGNDERMSLWRREGEMALAELRARENQKPDLSTGLKPGYQAWGMRSNPNETWPYLMEG